MHVMCGYGVCVVYELCGCELWDPNLGAPTVAEFRFKRASNP
jgi:hypothetical protein